AIDRILEHRIRFRTTDDLHRLELLIGADDSDQESRRAADPEGTTGLHRLPDLGSVAVTLEARAEARGVESDSFRVARKRLGVGGLRVGEQAIVHFPEAAFVGGTGGGDVLLVRQRMKSLDGK